MIMSPPMSSLCTGASPSPAAMILAPSKTIQPRSMTRSARTITALLRTVWFGCNIIITPLSSVCGSKGCHVHGAVGDERAHLVIMNDGDHGDTISLLLGDEIGHKGTVSGI